jgi:cytochrome c556
MLKMTRFVKFIGGLTVCAAMQAVTPPTVAYAADDQDVIDYRQHTMKTIGQQAATIGMILQKKAPEADLATHVQALALAASMALIAFEPKVQGGNAKPEVWAKWDEFQKRMMELQVNTADLAKVAKDGPAALAPKMQAALTCKGCHDTFRKELNK